MSVIGIQKLKYSGLIILAALFCVGFSNCHLNERLRNVRNTFVEEDAIKVTRSIRDAQKVHKQKFGVYGTIPEMVDKGLLATWLKSGKDSDYLYVITLENERYFLTARPKSNYSENYNFTLYVDDSGVIRFSETPEKPAASDSYPLPSQ